jgi:hypothetical protein
VPVAWALAVAVASVILFTRLNGFSVFRHPDEPDKVAQVIGGEWNLHHPPMLLWVTDLAVRVSGTARDEQSVAGVGRAVSACFCAMGVGALSLFAWRWKGPVAGVLAGLLLLTHHQLFELAHYFKEDTPLLAGVALSFLAMQRFRRTGSRLSAALLGGACAVAASGKYLGLAMVPLALFAVLMRPKAEVCRDEVPHLNWGWFLAALLAGIALLNWPIFGRIPTLFESVGREMEFAFEGRHGMRRRIPHGQYWPIFIDNTTPALWAGIAGVIVLVVRRIAGGKAPRAFRERPVESLLALLPFAMGIGLSFSPKSHDRYFLPATALLTVIGSIGLLSMAGSAPARWRRAAAGVLALTAVACQFVTLPSPLDWKTLPEYYGAFSSDDRMALRQWIEETLRPEDGIAQDGRVGLPVTGNKRDAHRYQPLAQRVLGSKFAADLGSLDDLRDQGISYAVVSQSDYGRYFIEGMEATPGTEEEAERRRAFYERLFAEGELVWERPRGTVLYLHPGLKVYRIAAP